MSAPEDTAIAGEVWQEADNVLVLCVVPGQVWGDFRGARFAWDADTIARPLRRLLDANGELVPEYAHATNLQSLYEAWMIAGPVPEHHRRMQNRLRADWPTLAIAVQRLVTGMIR